MLTSAAPVDRIITKGRSASSNGARLWPKTTDGRHTSARRLRDLVQSYAAIIGVTTSPHHQAAQVNTTAAVWRGVTSIIKRYHRNGGKP